MMMRDDDRLNRWSWYCISLSIRAGTRSSAMW